jgi:hypothetical protein
MLTWRREVSLLLAPGRRAKSERCISAEPLHGASLHAGLSSVQHSQSSAECLQIYQTSQRCYKCLSPEDPEDPEDPEWLKDVLEPEASAVAAPPLWYVHVATDKPHKWRVVSALRRSSLRPNIYASTLRQGEAAEAAVCRTPATAGRNLRHVYWWG